MNIDLVNPLEISTWDSSVAGLNGGVFHSRAWASVLSEAYAFRPMYLLAKREDRWLGVLPLMEVNSPWTGRRGISLPFTDVAPLIAQDRMIANELIERAFDLGHEKRWRYLELRGSELEIPNARPSLSFYGHTIPLNRSADQLFDAMDSSTRRAVRKAEKSGLRIEFSTSEQSVSNFYRLQCMTRRKHGLPPQPYCFYRALGKALSVEKLGTIATAWRQDQPVAASVFLQFGTQAVLKFAASDARYQELRGNNFVLWKSIQAFQLQGLESMDLGRTSLANEGLRRFKSGFGATEHQIDYLKFDFQEGRFTQGKDLSIGWHTRIFQLLPTFASRMVGSLLYKHLA